MLLIAVPALAAPTGWKAPADCVVPPDDGLYDQTGQNLTGCIDGAVWAAAEAVADNSGYASQAGLLQFPSGTSQVGSNGVTYLCPEWFGFFSCVLPPEAR